ncbi:MAG TPA: uroporphyrinogen-III synthase [Gemmatimonadaceae bacterium]|jgi:uroporphyrinogen-III synthase|nr:uroporphyrinogen-III synthase [Gemmatimonadaceae bacterium]
MSALAGRRIVVTRARDQAESFAIALEERGAIPVFFPTIQIRPLDDTRVLDAAVRALEQYKWIVFTSANAASAFWERMTACGRASIPDGVRIAAVGPVTSARLATLGVAVDAQPGKFIGTEIAGAMGDIRDARILMPRGEDAREETLDSLRDAGGRVDDIVAYRTGTGAPTATEFEAMLAPMDAVTFTSPSCVRGFSTLLGDRAYVIVETTIVVTIGPTTSEAARDAGWPKPIEAETSTVAGIIAALEAHFRHSSQSQDSSAA